MIKILAVSAVLAALAGAPARAGAFERSLQLDAFRHAIAQAAPAPAIRSQALSPDRVTARNRADLMSYLASNARQGNNFDEELAVHYLRYAPRLSDVQARLLKALFDGSAYENDFDEDAAFRRVLLSPRLGAAQAAVLGILAGESQYENNFDESAAFDAVLDSPEFSMDKARRLVRIFRDARYENGVDDTRLFLDILYARGFQAAAAGAPSREDEERRMAREIVEAAGKVAWNDLTIKEYSHNISGASYYLTLEDPAGNRVETGYNATFNHVTLALTPKEGPVPPALAVEGGVLEKHPSLAAVAKSARDGIEASLQRPAPGDSPGIASALVGDIDKVLGTAPGLP